MRQRTSSLKLRHPWEALTSQRRGVRGRCGVGNHGHETWNMRMTGWPDDPGGKCEGIVDGKKKTDQSSSQAKVEPDDLTASGQQWPWTPWTSSERITKRTCWHRLPRHLPRCMLLGAWQGWTSSRLLLQGGDPSQGQRTQRAVAWQIPGLLMLLADQRSRLDLGVTRYYKYTCIH